MNQLSKVRAEKPGPGSPWQGAETRQASPPSQSLPQPPLEPRVQAVGAPGPGVPSGPTRIAGGIQRPVQGKVTVKEEQIMPPTNQRGTRK